MLKLIFLPVSLGSLATSGYLFYRTTLNFTSQQPDIVFLIMEWMFTLILFTTGAILLVIALFGKEVKPGETSLFSERKRAMGFKTPEEEWQAGEVTSRGKSPMVFAWIKTVFFSLMIAPVLWIGVTRGFIGQETFYRWWCMTALIPLLMLIFAVFQTLRWRKYGVSICQIARRPDRTSGELQFMIHPKSQELPAGDATVELRCEKRTSVRTKNGRRTVSIPLWKEQKTISSQNGLIQGTFLVPANQPDASKNQGESFHWILEATIAAPGVNYLASFNLALKRA